MFNISSLILNIPNTDQGCIKYYVFVAINLNYIYHTELLWISYLGVNTRCYHTKNVKQFYLMTYSSSQEMNHSREGWDGLLHCFWQMCIIAKALAPLMPRRVFTLTSNWSVFDFLHCQYALPGSFSCKMHRSRPTVTQHVSNIYHLRYNNRGIELVKELDKVVVWHRRWSG